MKRKNFGLVMLEIIEKFMPKYRFDANLGHYAHGVKYHFECTTGEPITLRSNTSVGRAIFHATLLELQMLSEA